MEQESNCEELYIRQENSKSAKGLNIEFSLKK